MAVQDDEEAAVAVMKYRKQFDVWWRPITLQGDPLHRADLVGDAFDGGYEAGRRDALKILCQDIESGNYRPSAESVPP